MRAILLLRFVYQTFCRLFVTKQEMQTRFLSECRRKEQISKPVLLTLSRTCQVVSQKKRETQKEARVGRSGGYLIELGCSLRRSLCCGNFVPLPHGVPIQVTLRRYNVDDPVDPRNLVGYYGILRIYVTKSFTCFFAEIHIYLHGERHIR